MAVPQDSETPQRVQNELRRLEKRASKSEKALQALVARRADPQYAAKVPETVRTQDDARLVQLETDVLATAKSVAALQELQHQY